MILSPGFEVLCVCGRRLWTLWPEGIKTLEEASPIATETLRKQGWDIEGGSCLATCPRCVAIKKRPAQWAKEADPEEAMRLEAPNG